MIVQDKLSTLATGAVYDSRIAVLGGAHWTAELPLLMKTGPPLGRGPISHEISCLKKVGVRNYLLKQRET